MSGKQKMSKGILSALVSLGVVVAGVTGFYLGESFIESKHKNQVLTSIVNTNELSDVSNLEVIEASKSFVIKTEKGEIFYALYDSSFTTPNNIRVIAGDGYLVHGNKLIPYVTKSDGTKYTLPSYKGDNHNEILEKEEIIKEKDDEILSLINDINVLEDEKEATEQVQIELDKKVNSLLKRLEGTSGTTNKAKLLANKDSLSLDNTDDSDGSVIFSSTAVTNNEQGNGLSSQRLTTRDRLLQKIPEEKRDDVQNELSSAANHEFKKQAIIEISPKISGFTIDYPAYTNEEKMVITAFVDPLCPFCQKMHGDLERLRHKGYTVRYLPIPKGGMSSNITNQLAEVSCASKEDSPRLMDQLFQGKRFDTSNTPASCINSIQKYLDLAIKLGATKTPFIFADNGNVSEGYSGMDRLLSELEESDK